MLRVAFSVLLLTTAACQRSPEPSTPVRVMEALSTDALQGRRAGTQGAEDARAVLVAELANLDLVPDRQTFRFDNARTEEVEDIPAENLLIELDHDPHNTGPLLVITAHYDHLGVRNGEIYNGADDNASGVGALFGILEQFIASPPEHDVLFAFLDAEEFGMEGAEVLVASDWIRSRSVFNLNLDMVSQNKDGIIYASGTRHNPEVLPLLDALDIPDGVEVKFGYDDPADPPNDWTFQSDHRAFHEVGMPYIYFGVEDHPHYHKPTDDFETIPVETYERFVEMLTAVAVSLDTNLDSLARPAMVMP